MNVRVERLPLITNERVDPHALFRAHSPYVLRLALRLIGHSSHAEDLTQEVFCRALTHLDQLRDPGAARAWLRRITIRLCMRKLQRQKFVQWLGFEPIADEHVSAGTLAPDDSALLGEVHRMLRRASAGERTAWILRRVEGESLDVIARECRCSLATVKRWIARVDLLFGEAP